MKIHVFINLLQVSPVKYVQEGTLPIISIILKDKTGSAKACLFGQNPELNFESRNMVEDPKLYCNVTQLTSTATTKCQVSNFNY